MITLRQVKGTRLTHAELDGNFEDLDLRVLNNSSSIQAINDAISDILDTLSSMTTVSSVNGQTGAVVLDGADIAYDGTASGLIANNIQDAIDEVMSSLDDFIVNPMTTAGDLIVGGTDGVPVRLPLGDEGQVLSVVSGALTYIDLSAADISYNDVNFSPPIGNVQGIIDHLINEVFFNPRASDEDYVLSTGLVVNGDSIPSIADGDEWSAIYNVYLPGAAVTNSDVIYAWLSSANPQPDGLIFSFTAGLNSVDTTGEYYPVKVQIINRSGVAYQPGTGSNIMIRVLQIRQSLP